MAPKTKFDRDLIIETALDIAKEKGLTGITARNVAKKLESSVAPIYVNFKTIEELIDAVVERVFKISEELLIRQDGKTMFEKIGKASLEFAREYPILFRELSIEPNPYMDSYESMEKIMLEAMAKDEKIKDWRDKERRILLLKMRIFQMGLSAMIANGHIPIWIDNKELDELLMEVGEELLIACEIKREGKV